MKKLSTTICAVALAAAAAAMAAPAAAQVFVDKSAPAGGDGQSWVTAFNNIAAGIAAAPGRGETEVWVADGVYGESRTNGTLALAPNVLVYGGFAGGETELSARNIAANPAVIDASTANAGGAAAIAVLGANGARLDGFTVRGARGGTGLLNSNSSSVYANLLVTDNESDTFGGGIRVTSGGSAQVINCTFSNNEGALGGGAIGAISSTLTVSGSNFDTNSTDADGGGIYLDAASTLTITNSLFQGNTAANEGAGIYAGEGVSLTVGRCRFDGNIAQARGGGISNNEAAAAVITNSYFTGNDARVHGGGINNTASSPLIVNCTIADNTSQFRGPGVYGSSGAALSIVNSIVWFNVSENTDEQIGFIDTSSLDVSFTNLEDAVGGEAVIDADPRFLSRAGGDYRLRTDSPSIDAGRDASGAAFGSVTVDFEGQDRGFDSFGGVRGDGSDYDQGADEVQEASTEGEPEGTLEGEGEGVAEGEGEGIAEGEGEGDPVAEAVFVDIANTSGVENGRGWATAFREIQDGIDSARVRGLSEVWVANGTYGERRGLSGTLDLAGGVSLYGGFAGNETSRAQREAAANVTIIDGSTAAGGGPASTVVSGDDNLTLDGFTIRGGRGDSAAGMLNQEVSALTISNCTFTDNIATQFGGAMYNFGGTNFGLVITNCRFIGNSAGTSGGALLNQLISPVIRNCVFEGNEAAVGGAIFNLDRANAAIEGCTFRLNTATTSGGAIASLAVNFEISECVFDRNAALETVGGALLITGGSPVIERTLFVGNSADAQNGGAIAITPADLEGDAVEASLQLSNSIFAQNNAGSAGGAITANNATLVTFHNTFYANTADSGGALALFDTSAEVLSSILWRNVGGAIQSSGSDITVEYSDVEGGVPGEGNINADPRFANSAALDFRLRPNSPAIDTGTSSINPTVDFDGDTRPVGAGWDMGAQEADGSAIEGEEEGQPEGSAEGEGQPEGTPEGQGEGEGEGQTEGVVEGEGEGGEDCTLGAAAITSPVDGATIYLPQTATGIPLLLTAETDCDSDVSIVSWFIDGIGLGAVAEPPFLNSLPAASEIGGGSFTFEIDATSITGAAPVSASAAIEIVETGTADNDNNGYPDDPYATLPNNRDTWLSQVVVPSTGEIRTTGVSSFVRTGAADPLPVVIALREANNPPATIVVTVPEQVLNAGERGIVLVTVAPDLATLLGAQEAQKVVPLPGAGLAAGGFYADVSILVSANNGASFVEIPPSRLLANPVKVEIFGITEALGSPVALLTHPSQVADVDTLGVALLGQTGEWEGRFVSGFQRDAESLRATLSRLSILAPAIASGAGAAIVVDPVAFDFGPWETGETGEAVFVISNPGTGVLVGSATTSLPFVVLSGSPYTLAPGESTEVTIGFRPTEEIDYTGVVRFSGGGGTEAALAGQGVPFFKRVRLYGCAGDAPFSGSGHLGDIAAAAFVATILAAWTLNRKRTTA